MTQNKKSIIELSIIIVVLISIVYFLNIFVIDMKKDLILDDFNAQVDILDDTNFSSQEVYLSSGIIKLVYQNGVLKEHPTNYSSNMTFNYQLYDQSIVNYDYLGAFVFDEVTINNETIIYLYRLNKSEIEIGNFFYLSSFFLCITILVLIHSYNKIRLKNNELHKRLSEISNKQFAGGSIEKRINYLFDNLEQDNKTTQLYERLLSITNDGVIVCDMNMNVVYVNKVLESIVSNNMHEKNINDEMLLNVVQNAKEGKFLQGNFDLLKENYFYQSYLSVIKDVKFVVVHFKNITEKVTFKNNQINFFNQASHELKTPLTIIQGYIDLMSMTGISDENKEKVLSLSNNECKKMNALISSIIDTSKRFRVHDEFKILNIATMINSYIEEFKIPNVDVTQSVPTRIPKICNETKVAIVLSNIIKNAFSHNIINGFVEIEVTNELGNTIVCVRNSCNKINKEELSKIFDPFFKCSTTTFDGSGIGLSLVKTICDAYNYDITYNCIKEIFEIKILFYSEEYSN